MSYHLFPSRGEAASAAASTKIALFDVDGTLVVSKSGRRWAANADDWVFLGDVCGVLDRYRRDGWIVALVSNQFEWKLSDVPRAKMQSVLDAIMAAVSWSPYCLAATAKTKEKDCIYRKPGRGLYDVLLMTLGLTATDVSELIMCGDACGADDPFPPYRWAASDAAFATAIGARFLRPCTVFGTAAPAAAAAPTKQELVILVGNPGSGKSLSGRALAAAGYVHIEQDVVGSKASVMKAVKAAIAEGKSVVVDATHGSATNREPYSKLAAYHCLPFRILWHIRDGRSFNALREKPVPEVAYAVYSKHFIAPVGFVEYIY